METKQAKQAVPTVAERAGKKAAYTPPQVEIIEMQMEGVMALSGIEAPRFDPGGSLIQSSRTGHGYNSASSNDVEDLINDIFTVEQ